MTSEKTESANPSGYVLRHPEFARRMQMACDGNPDIPPLNRGRLVWFVERLAEKGIEVRVETVRRWFGGFSYPRKDAMMALAQALKVDAGWLSSGSSQPKIDMKEAKKQIAVASAALNIVAGFMQLDGAHPAFPEEGDWEADGRQINLYAIIKGIKHSFHVTPLTGENRFEIPLNAEGSFVLGVVPNGRFSVRILELDWQTIQQKGIRRNATYYVPSDASDWREIESFTDRL